MVSIVEEGCTKQRHANIHNGGLLITLQMNLSVQKMGWDTPKKGNKGRDEREDHLKRPNNPWAKG